MIIDKNTTITGTTSRREHYHLACGGHRTRHASTPKRGCGILDASLDLGAFFEDVRVDFILLKLVCVLLVDERALLARPQLAGRHAAGEVFSSQSATCNNLPYIQNVDGESTAREERGNGSGRKCGAHLGCWREVLEIMTY